MELLGLRKPTKTAGPIMVRSRLFVTKQSQLHFVVYAPSAIPWSEKYPKPKMMTEEDMQYVEDAFVLAVKRCKKIGCKSAASFMNQ
jgi:2,4-dienoyl-CoA reductase-like NADH-dependent reductase (Old Yellow Enzyme family)